MGVDACIYLKLNRELSPAEIKRTQYELMHRMDADWYWRGHKDEPKEDFLVERNEYWHEPLADSAHVYEVVTMHRYYGPNYERGPALQIVGTLLYLMHAFPGDEVWYGGDSGDPEQFTKAMALELLDYFIAHGHHRYYGVFNDRDGLTSPICSYCQIEMLRNGWGPKYAAFYCAGCGEERVFEGVAFDASLTTAAIPPSGKGHPA